MKNAPYASAIYLFAAVFVMGMYIISYTGYKSSQNNGKVKGASDSVVIGRMVYTEPQPDPNVTCNSDYTSFDIALTLDKIPKLPDDLSDNFHLIKGRGYFLDVNYQQIREILKNYSNKSQSEINQLIADCKLQ